MDAIAKETPDLPVSGQKEFYVSKTAIYYWKPKDNSINKTMVDLFVFLKTNKVYLNILCYIVMENLQVEVLIN